MECVSSIENHSSSAGPVHQSLVAIIVPLVFEFRVGGIAEFAVILPRSSLFPSPKTYLFTGNQTRLALEKIGEDVRTA